MYMIRFLHPNNLLLNFLLAAVRGVTARQVEAYHPQLERSEFYSMANLTKPPVLFNPIPDSEEVFTKVLGLDIETGNAIIT